MKEKKTKSPYKTILACSIALSLSLAPAGCGQGGRPRAAAVKMGEQAQAGALIYSALEAEWKSHLGELPNAKIPKNRFLIVRLTVTNSGGTESAIPGLQLEDARGELYPEVTEVEGVPDWLGLLRRVAPAQTEGGRVVFDVPAGAYKLRVSNDAEPGSEQIALIEIPYQVHMDPLEPETPAVAR